MLGRRTLLLGAASLGADLTLNRLGTREAFAQAAYPSRAIELIVPFAPGGATDLTARVVAPALEAHWKVPVRVINKPGGNTVPAVSEVMRANPDGYSLLADSPASSSMLEVVVRNLPFQSMDRTFMGMISQAPFIFVVSPDSAIKTMADAIEQARKDPSTFSWTSLGGAGAPDYAFRRLFHSIGVDVRKTRPVASKGGNEAVIMTASGNVTLGVGSWASVSPLLGSGKLRALAVAAPTRFPLLPETPTTEEVGHPSVQVMFWFSVSGPPNLPAPVVKAWDEAIAAIAADPKVRETLQKIGNVPYVHPAEKVRAMVESEKKNVESLWAS
ncbi:tripartite tricarboxylate transporter substrate binding protein [Bosea sp. (in: a-proteobacteria)]|uniref:Bug family tripartite tricarboxylate transporter substrate binding protein n=1 Tax=Bosea sp. (in: a-proteobacteria) TaxID=1871050 RepID=UPI00260C80D3|nr:tripartite tricarboxylate transporter substrate binding protein [Bosea sp. (in: a-proteobacteria)]MCO5090102.1 tripartite tricarboxylate transporter substrate binding protein [Bosea sp. (in: a-proteobacteria)]